MENKESKIGDTIYSLNKDNVVEWEIIGKNPKNSRFFIIIDKNNNHSIKEVHWKTLQYGDVYDGLNVYSRSKSELLKRFKAYANNIIYNITKSIDDEQ
jgi:hypothetical protein